MLRLCKGWVVLLVGGMGIGHEDGEMLYHFGARVEEQFLQEEMLVTKLTRKVDKNVDIFAPN